MQQEFFARLIAEEVKGKATHSQIEYLHLPENWERWQEALYALLKNLDSQLQEIDDNERADERRFTGLGRDGIRLMTEASLSYEDRRKKIGRFRFHVQSRLDEVTRMITIGTPGHSSASDAAKFLRKAIETHKDYIEEGSRDPDAVDAALWAALDGVWRFSDLDREDS